MLNYRYLLLLGVRLDSNNNTIHVSVQTFFFIDLGRDEILVVKDHLPGVGVISMGSQASKGSDQVGVPIGN